MSLGNICSRIGRIPHQWSQDQVGQRQNRGHLFRHFIRDESGSYVILSALMMPVLVGAASLGTEVGWWLYKHKNMQSAADSGAVSAATAASA